jgi:hypothetical protein
MGTRADAGWLTEPVSDEADGLAFDALLDRMAVLAARVDEQAATIAGLQAENAVQQAEIAALKRGRPVSQARPAARISRSRFFQAAGAAAAGLAAGLVSRPQEVEAATGGPLLLGNINFATGTDATVVQNPTSSLTPIVAEARNFGVGVPTLPANTAVGFAGIGSSSGAPNAMPVIGVYGVANPGTTPDSASAGVRGDSTSGIGVYGQSSNNHGCGGATTKAGFSGLFGFTNVPGASALLGISSPANGTAGYFHGAVFVDGSFQVLNGAKAALVAHPDGSHRRVYCQEAPEPWFEDFGTARLQGGKAVIRLDPDYAAVVKADDYEVFPVPKGECNGLYIANQTPTSFEVRELRGGTSSVSFSYRLVARRKDNVGQRLEKVAIPRFDLDFKPPHQPTATSGGPSHER